MFLLKNSHLNSSQAISVKIKFVLFYFVFFKKGFHAGMSLNAIMLEEVWIIAVSQIRGHLLKII